MTHATEHIEPTIIVIFGAGGDLTWRKLVPALYNLYLDHWMPEHFAVIGVDRKEMSEEEFCQHLRDGVDRFGRRGKTKDETWEPFAPHMVEYFQADFDNDETYSSLKKKLSKKEKDWGGDIAATITITLVPCET